MIVLSLFDGLSGGMLALERAGITVEKYYSSEIDKFAIQVSEANYPNIIRLGDVQAINYQLLPPIDLLIGGSPCQGFSMAGKQLNFSDPRSALFFEFVSALKEVKPKYFLFENVRMKKSIKDEISRMLGCEPIEINSALVSAQSRKRLYWTNIPNVEQPVDKGVVLADIVQHEVDDSFYHTDKAIAYMERGNDKWKQAGSRRADKYTQSIEKEKSFTVTANIYKGVPYNYFKCASMIGRKINPETGKRDDYNPNIKAVQRLEIRADDKTGTLSTVQKDNYLVLNETINTSEKSHVLTASYSAGIWASNSVEKNQRTLIPVGETDKETNQSHNGIRYRKLTPVECERLQTIPDNYTNHVSNTQRYKMIGNGWTIDVIAHIFKQLRDL